jgi:hypothetical protein
MIKNKKISKKTLTQIEKSILNLKYGKVGSPVNVKKAKKLFKK